MSNKKFIQIFIKTVLFSATAVCGELFYIMYRIRCGICSADDARFFLNIPNLLLDISAVGVFVVLFGIVFTYILSKNFSK